MRPAPLTSVRPPPGPLLPPTGVVLRPPPIWGLQRVPPSAPLPSRPARAVSYAPRFKPETGYCLYEMTRAPRDWPAIIFVVAFALVVGWSLWAASFIDKGLPVPGLGWL